MSEPNPYLPFIGEPFFPEIVEIIDRDQTIFTFFLPEKFMISTGLSFDEVDLKISSLFPPYKIEKVKAIYAKKEDKISQVKGLTCAGYNPMTLTVNQTIAINTLANWCINGLIWN